MLSDIYPRNLQGPIVGPNSCVGDIFLQGSANLIPLDGISNLYDDLREWDGPLLNFFENCLQDEDHEVGKTLHNLVGLKQEWVALDGHLLHVWRHHDVGVVLRSHFGHIEIVVEVFEVFLAFAAVFVVTLKKLIIIILNIFLRLSSKLFDAKRLAFFFELLIILLLPVFRNLFTLFFFDWLDILLKLIEFTLYILHEWCEVCFQVGHLLV